MPPGDAFYGMLHKRSFRSTLLRMSWACLRMSGSAIHPWWWWPHGMYMFISICKCLSYFNCLYLCASILSSGNSGKRTRVWMHQPLVFRHFESILAVRYSEAKIVFQPNIFLDIKAEWLNQSKPYIKFITRHILVWTHLHPFFKKTFYLLN